MDYAHVATDIADLLSNLDVEAVAFDRWRMDVMKGELDRLGLHLPLVPFG